MSAYQRRSRQEDARFFRALAEAFAQLVVGLPVHLNGREGAKAREARAFGRWLGEITGLPVVFWDERFTSVEAEQLLLAAGLTSKRRKARRDKVAAQILLQSYLDAGCPPEQPFGPLEG
jgi:putative Holliday junction resolvase